MGVSCNQIQGGYGTGKTMNLALTFSNQEKHREFLLSWKCSHPAIAIATLNVFDAK